MSRTACASACYLWNYRNARDATNLFLDVNLIAEHRRKRLLRSMTKARIILMRWISEVDFLEENEVLTAEQNAMICGMLQPEIQWLSQELEAAQRAHLGVVAKGS